MERAMEPFLDTVILFPTILFNAILEMLFADRAL